MRIANEIAADAMEHVRGRLEPGMKESEAAAIWQGFVHGQGTAREEVALALPFSLVWAGRGIKTFTATGDLPVTADEPVLFEIWVCADGYWADHTKNLVIGELPRGLPRARGRACSASTSAPSRTASRAHRSPSSTSSCATGSTSSAIPGSRRIRSATASARGRTSRPYPHQAGGGTVDRGHGAGDRARLLLAGRRRTARGGQLPDHCRRRGEAVELSRRSRVVHELIWTGSLNDRVRDSRPRRPLRHDAARRRTDRRRRARPRTEARDRAPARRPRRRPDRGGLPARVRRRLAGGQADLRSRPASRGVGLLASGPGRPRGARRARREPIR